MEIDQLLPEREAEISCIIRRINSESMLFEFCDHKGESLFTIETPVLPGCVEYIARYLGFGVILFHAYAGVNGGGAGLVYEFIFSAIPVAASR